MRETGIIGLGKLGLPLALVFSKHFKVKGVDISEERIGQINEQRDFFEPHINAYLEKYRGNLNISTKYNSLANCEVTFIITQTPSMPTGKFSIRGGRLGKEAVYIDGILVRAFSEQAYLSDKISSDNSPLVVGKNSVEEVNVITGGFNAEYGQAQSGVINIISREGADRLAGSAQLISDFLMPRTEDYGYNELSLDLSVPLGLPGFSSISLSTELKGMADATPSVHGGNAGAAAGAGRLRQAGRHGGGCGRHGGRGCHRFTGRRIPRLRTRRAGATGSGADRTAHPAGGTGLPEREVR